jgi:hypothetical protein
MMFYLLTALIAVLNAAGSSNVTAAPAAALAVSAPTAVPHVSKVYKNRL